MSGLVDGLVIDLAHCSRESCKDHAREVIIDFLKRLADQVYESASPETPEDVGVHDAYMAGLLEMRRILLDVGA